MGRREFLTELREHLEGYIPEADIEENLIFYRNYFDESDKTESELIEELGEPRLIAKTIIDAYRASKGAMADYYTRQAQEEYKRKYDRHYEETMKQTQEDAAGTKSFTGIKIGICVLAVVLILLLLVLAGTVLVAAVYLLPVLLLVIVGKILVDYFRKN